MTEAEKASPADSPHSPDSSDNHEESSNVVQHPIFYTVFTYALLSLVFLHPSTPLIIYSDSLGLIDAVDFLTFTIPMFLISIAVILKKTPQKMILPLVLSTYCVAPWLSCLSTSVRMEYYVQDIGDTSSYSVNSLVEDSIRDKHYGSWIRRGRENSSKHYLIHVNRSGGGSGSIQSQALAVVRKIKGSTYEVHSSVQYTYSGNRLRGRYVDLIVPLRVYPFTDGQFWFKKEQDASVNRLLFLDSDWRFQERSLWWVLLPFLTSLIPLLFFIVFRTHYAMAMIGFGVLFGLWCLAFAPWQYHGYAYLS